MATFELNNAREELSRALQETPDADPGRTALEAELRQILTEQESRHRREMASRGRSPR
jgi:hypothetical protein